jgi:hypothetical protein
MKETMTTERKIEKEYAVKKPIWRYVTANSGTDKTKEAGNVKVLGWQDRMKRRK